MFQEVKKEMHEIINTSPVLGKLIGGLGVVRTDDHLTLFNWSW